MTSRGMSRRMKTTDIVFPLNVLDQAHGLAAVLGEGASDTLWSMIELQRWALAGLRLDAVPSSQGWLSPDSGPKLLAELWEWGGKPLELVAALEGAHVIRKDEVAGWRVAGLERYDSDWAKTFAARSRKQDWRAKMQGRAARREEDSAFVAVPPKRSGEATIRGRKGVVLIGAAKKKVTKGKTAAKTSKVKAPKRSAKKKASAE